MHSITCPAGATRALLGSLILFFALIGCNASRFPSRPLKQESLGGGYRQVSFDLDRNGKADYWQVLDPNGRKVELKFKSGPRVELVDLHAIPAQAVPHFIIVLDGVPYELVEELYHEGSFRLFYPPSRLISTFPAMTDLAFNQIFHTSPPLAFQSEYYDRDRQRVINGNDVYLSGVNADWASKLVYRAPFYLDAISYTNPQFVFDHEMSGTLSAFRSIDRPGAYSAYSVGTAGLGTRHGREGILRYLRALDRICEQIVYERQGRVKITLLADHGHNMSGRGRITFDRLLAEAGYRLTDRLDSPRDVVEINFGLVTYADFYTADPAGLAGVLLSDPAVNLAFYPEADSVIVLALEGKARVQFRDGRYRYAPEMGDPLKLNPIIAQLRQAGAVDADGFIADQPLFEATVTHLYPDPLHRVWAAFHGVVQQPSDLIVTLHDGWVHGSNFFATMIGDAQSTHGSLNRLNSTSIVLTMKGPLPPALRPEDVLPVLEK